MTKLEISFFSSVSSAASQPSSPRNAEDLLQPPRQGRLPFANQVMLPNPHHPPPGLAQRAIDNPVPRPICRQLLAPEKTVVFRFRRVLWAGMPETTIHKNHQPQFPKHKIRLPKNRMMSPPPRNLVPPQQPRQSDLGILVPPPFDTRHYGRPFRLRENIRHAA